MDRTYVLTPEMLGLTWPRLFRRALARSVVYLLTAIALSTITKGHWTLSLSTALIGAAFDFVLTFVTVRSYASTRLRITDDRIEDVNGPIILKRDVLAVNDCNDAEPYGLEVIGRRSPAWLPRYRIFIPAALADFNELRQMIRRWSTSS